MTKKYPSILKIDNKNITVHKTENAKTAAETVKTTNLQSPSHAAQNVSYADYIQRHRRLSQMIDAREKEKNR